MLSFKDVIDRAIDGPLVPDQDYYLRRYVPELNKVIQKYNIKYNPEVPLPSDDALADRVFEAAVDFFARVGAYCPDTSRVMQFTREEILEAAAEAPSESTFGEGTDRKTMKARKPDEHSEPWYHCGGGIYTTSDTIFMNQVEELANIRKANSLSIPSSIKFRGRDARVRSPHEVLATIKTVTMAREACRRAGRPGLPILNGISTATGPISMFAASHPNFGLRPSDGFLVDSLAELIVDFEALDKVAFYTSIGANIGSTSTPLFGGYNGGAEGNAVVTVVYNLLGILVFRGTYHYNAPLHAKLRVSSTRPLLWVIAVANQALERNAPYPTVNLPYLGGGAGTDCYYYEMAAYHSCVVTSGGNMLSGHPSFSVAPDSILPLDHVLNVEVAEAASKLTRKETNPIVLKLLEKYENQVKDPPQGLRYQDCYDINTGKLINSEYEKHIDHIRNELKGLGLPIVKSI
ncbi:MAG: monomethylamine:corrinoid methyltransferase [Spirochaetota bacterium]